MGVLEELREAATRATTDVGRSVVRIGRGEGRGVGVVVGDGAVVTNAHNLRGPEATVTFADGRQAVGRAAGVDVDGDLAVLAVDTAGVPAVAWGDEPQAGQPVFTVAAGAGGTVRVSLGVVSAVGQAFRGPRGRRITGSFEHTAPLSRGSSGSPVVDGSGRVVGINTNRLGDGFYLALPTDATLRSRLDALAEGRAPVRRRLGVALAPPQAARHLRRAVGLPERDGLLVRQVEDGGPAHRAGLRQGDLLVSAGGQPLVATDDLFAALEAVAPGGALVVGVVRGLDELDVEVGFDEPAPE